MNAITKHNLMYYTPTNRSHENKKDLQEHQINGHQLNATSKTSDRKRKLYFFI